MKKKDKPWVPWGSLGFLKERKRNKNKGIHAIFGVSLVPWDFPRGRGFGAGNNHTTRRDIPSWVNNKVTRKYIYMYITPCIHYTLSSLGFSRTPKEPKGVKTTPKRTESTAGGH